MEQQLSLGFVDLKQDAERLTSGQFVDLLAEEGWDYCGSGACATVRKSPDGERVIKIIGGDAGARATAYAAQANPDNPHFPRVGWIVTNCWGDTIVECEALQPVSGALYSDWKTTWSGKRVPLREYVSQSDLTDAEDCPMKAALLALIDHAEQESPDGGIVWDVHSENLMVRPSTGELILNDCLYYAGTNCDSDYYSSDSAPCACEWSDCGRCQPKFSQADFHRWVPAPGRADWKLMERLDEHIQAQRHAQGRHCGAYYCPECCPQELPLAA